MFLTLATATALSMANVPSCSWDRPGVDPFMGDVPAAVERYRDIPPAVRVALRERMEKRDYDDIAVIRRDEIVGRHRYGELRDMHFGKGRLCRSVARSGWSQQMEERGLVYCEQGHCVIVPTVCRNVSRVTRLDPPQVAKDGPDELEFDPPGAGLPRDTGLGDAAPSDPVLAALLAPGPGQGAGAPGFLWPTPGPGPQVPRFDAPATGAVPGRPGAPPFTPGPGWALPAPLPLPWIPGPGPGGEWPRGPTPGTGPGRPADPDPEGPPVPPGGVPADPPGLPDVDDWPGQPWELPTEPPDSPFVDPPFDPPFDLPFDPPVMPPSGSPFDPPLGPPVDPVTGLPPMAPVTPATPVPEPHSGWLVLTALGLVGLTARRRSAHRVVSPD